MRTVRQRQNRVNYPQTEQEVVPYDDPHWNQPGRWACTDSGLDSQDCQFLADTARPLPGEPPAEYVLRQAAWYAALDQPPATLLADCLHRLAADLAASGATDVHTLLDRLEALEREYAR